MLGSTSPVYMATRITILLLLSWLSETASGGCTRYGHACWGGHGKRSGGLTSVGGEGPAVWAPSDFVLARVASGGPLAALLDVSGPDSASRTGTMGQPWQHLTSSDDVLGPTRARIGERARNIGSPDMMSAAASGGSLSNDAGQDDEEISGSAVPRDLLVMAAGDPADQQQLHLYKILNRSTRKVN